MRSHQRWPVAVRVPCVAIDDHKAQCLFGEVVVRLDAWRGDELKVGLAMFRTLGRFTDRRKTITC